MNNKRLIYYAGISLLFIVGWILAVKFLIPYVYDWQWKDFVMQTVKEMVEQESLKTLYRD